MYFQVDIYVYLKSTYTFIERCDFRETQILKNKKKSAAFVHFVFDRRFVFSGLELAIGVIFRQIEVRLTKVWRRFENFDRETPEQLLKK